MNEYVSTEQDSDNRTTIYIFDEATFTLQHYEDEFGDFYGIYWDTDFNGSEFVSNTSELINDIYSSATNDDDDYSVEFEDVVVNGILTQDFTTDLRISEEGLAELLHDARANPSMDKQELYDHLSAYFGEEFAENEPITLFRINTDYFNIGWEIEDSMQRIGLLAHRTAIRPIAEVCLTSEKYAEFETDEYDDILQQLDDVLKSETQEYGEYEL